MGSSRNREQYFNKIVKPAPTVTDYMLALAKSPYRMHRRMAENLMPMYEQLIQDKVKQDNVNEFSKTLEL